MTEAEMTAMGFRNLADGMARMFDAARETERACLSAAEATPVAAQRHVDPLDGNEFAWLLRASRRGEENDGLRDAYAAWRRRNVR